MISRSSASAAGEWHGERLRGLESWWLRRAHRTAPLQPPRSSQAAETSSLNDARLRPLNLDSVPVALRVPADLAVEFSHGLAWRTAEPQEGTKLKGVLVEHHPDDAAARLILEVAIDRDLLGLATPVGALQLDRAPDPLVAEHELVAVPVDLRAQHLDIVHRHAPKRPQKVAKKDVLQNLFAPARMGGMDRINGAGDLLRVR